jgi:hypothetical protein
MEIVTQIKRIAYTFGRPEMVEMSTSSKSVNETSRETNTESCISLDLLNYFVKPGRTMTWKGENETLECLTKITRDFHKHVYHVVKGYVQSGKSSLMIYYTLWMIKRYNMNVVIILRNQTADSISIANKFKEIKKAKEVKNVDVWEFNKLYNAMDEEQIEQFFSGSGKVLILLGNSDQLNKLNQCIEICGNNTNHFSVCIDEIDLNDKQAGTRFQQEMETFKACGHIFHCLGVTGTALPVLFKNIDTLTSEQILSLKAPQNYKGINNITFTYIDVDDKNVASKMLTRVLESDYAFYDQKGTKHPVIMLIKDERVKVNQLKGMNNLYDVHGRKWAIIVYNGDGLYLRLPGKLTLPGTMLQNKTKTYKILMKDDGLIICKGKFGINDCLQLIKDQFQNAISHICIISGDLASRGLSFVSMDYDWHLTHMVLCAKSSSNGSNLIQFTRLCGCYNDDIPLEMFTSKDIADELHAYDKLQEMCIENCESPHLSEEQLIERLSKLKIDPAAKVKRPIDSKLTLKYKNISNFNKTMYGKEIQADSIRHAIDIVRQEYGVEPKVLVEKLILNMRVTPTNIPVIKRFLSNNYGIDKYINVVDEARYTHLYKNPFFVTSTYKNSMAMISNNGKEIGEVYIKRFKKEDLVYGELFLFESPNGIFLSSNTDETQLKRTFEMFGLILF